MYSISSIRLVKINVDYMPNGKVWKKIVSRCVQWSHISCLWQREDLISFGQYLTTLNVKVSFFLPVSVAVHYASSEQLNCDSSNSLLYYSPCSHAGSFSTEKKGGDLMKKSVINLNSAFPALLKYFLLYVQFSSYRFKAIWRNINCIALKSAWVIKHWSL